MSEAETVQVADLIADRLPVLAAGPALRERLAEDPAGLAAGIHSLRRRHGAVLLRGADIDADGVAEVEALAAAICGRDRLMAYDGERASPRRALGGHVYTSTDYDRAGRIFVHNEMSSRLSWPLFLIFACVTPARAGGATPLCDVRAVTRALDPAVQEGFARHGILYRRNYGAEFGVSIEYAFGTGDRAAVDAYCAAQAIEAEWKADGSLGTRFRRAAHARHPETGETLWFNYATFYSRAALEPRLRRLMRGVPDSGMAFSAAYGDGERVPDAVFDACRDAYEAATYRFDWQAGDVLLLDNMLSAHGRDPFEGERSTLVVMASEAARLEPMSADTRLVGTQGGMP